MNSGLPSNSMGVKKIGTGLNCLGAVRVKYPDIVYWLHYLDEHPDRSDGIQFSQYTEILKEHGFIRVSQLSADFVTPRDLADWLVIAVGTAVSLVCSVPKSILSRYSLEILSYSIKNNITFANVGCFVTRDRRNDQIWNLQS